MHEWHSGEYNMRLTRVRFPIIITFFCFFVSYFQFVSFFFFLFSFFSFHGERSNYIISLTTEPPITQCNKQLQRNGIHANDFNIVFKRITRRKEKRVPFNNLANLPIQTKTFEWLHVWSEPTISIFYDSHIDESWSDVSLYQFEKRKHYLVNTNLKILKKKSLSQEGYYRSTDDVKIQHDAAQPPIVTVVMMVMMVLDN